MNWFPPGLLVVPVALLLAAGLIPAARVPQRHGLRTDTAIRRFQSGLLNGQQFGWMTIILIGLSFLASLAAAASVITTGPIEVSLVQWTRPVPFCLGLHIDAIAVVMMMLISFIGFVIARYSMRYLRGDAGQARFFRWMAVTLGATLLLVMSCNLVMLTAAWMLTSFGLHQLLLYYPERTWAVWAARKKFLISRLGDLMLIVALILTYREFGTTEFTTLFAAADAIHAGTRESSFAISLIGLLFVLGAMTKSAQFPFHSWLPDTMETPTPVSALMHAGVINAGGFLVIRLSPVVSLSPMSLDLLAVMGAITALLGSVVMLTQTSVKRSLAYSTVAQMGFMMLQCGLGAFSAALLHIVAHSAYKAHAFLSSGSVLDHAARRSAPALPAPSTVRSLLSFAAAVAFAIVVVGGTLPLMGIDLHTKPGGAVLGLVLTIALTQLVLQGFVTGSPGLAVRSMAAALLVTCTYAVAYLGMDYLVKGSTTHALSNPSSLHVAVLAFAGLGFVLVFLLQTLSEPFAKHRWVKSLYVHAMNGFYIDIPARQLTARFYHQASPVQ